MKYHHLEKKLGRSRGWSKRPHEFSFKHNGRLTRVHGVVEGVYEDHDRGCWKGRGTIVILSGVESNLSETSVCVHVPVTKLIDITKTRHLQRIIGTQET